MGSRAGSAGGRGGRVPQRKGAESTGQGVEFVKVTRGEEGGSSGMVEAKRSGKISREVGNSPGG